MRPEASALILAFALALGATAADVPEAYQVIAQRNLFSPSRVGTPPRLPAAAVETPPPTETLTLTGVAVLEGRATALFAGSTAGLSGAHQVGGALDNLRLTSVSTAGVSFDADGQAGPLRLAVGQSLRRLLGQPWQLTASAAPAAAPAAAPQATAPAGDTGDILKRLLERRKKEMNP
jgi:hypothetical protein